MDNIVVTNGLATFNTSQFRIISDKTINLVLTISIILWEEEGVLDSNQLGADNS
jgi:hypothetical protein